LPFSEAIINAISSGGGDYCKEKSKEKNCYIFQQKVKEKNTVTFSSLAKSLIVGFGDDRMMTKALP